MLMAEKYDSFTITLFEFSGMFRLIRKLGDSLYRNSFFIMQYSVTNA